MNHQRPIDLNFASLKFPPMAIVSILHRISGIGLFLLLPLMLYLLKLSLASAASFEHLHMLMATCAWYKIGIFAFTAALIYHLIAGIRHLLMDMGLGESLVAARRSSLVVIGLSVVGTLLFGAYLWSVV
ncbi:MAG: succinate dehydrogenase, cytochrome b556 subunit [Legionellaceae bacterium]|nr:succinate dehydrogenase, cytochrome b556 subunit [Legionellaceae bacterium]